MVAVFLLGIACREPFGRLAGGHASADAHAGAAQLFGALGARVTDPTRDQKYDTARKRIAVAALLPSRVFDDTSVWTGTSDLRRTLFVNGRFADGRYRLAAARTPASVTQAAESHHAINLTRLASDQYAWDTDVVYSIGTPGAANVGSFVTALVASAEGRSEREIRADYREAAPRFSVIMGQLFRVDSIRTTRLPDHSTLATFGATMIPAGLEAHYPNFARYLRRYAESARMRWELTDRAGNRFVDCSAVDGRMTFRVRTLGGVIVPLGGPAHPMPDSLLLVGEFTMKVRHFTVGFRAYQADFTVIRTAHERAWSIVSRREPQWVLPLVTERLLRTPLRRPFQGGGATFRVGVREDSASGQTLLQRRLHLEVQESLILRFLGRLGSIAVSDFSGQVEREQYAWLRELFTALAADASALAPSSAP